MYTRDQVVVHPLSSFWFPYVISSSQYQVTVISQSVQPFGTPRTFSVPSANFTNGQGFFQAQVPFAANKTFLAIMSDANGYGTGGVSNLLTVGAPVSNTNCNTTDPGVYAEKPYHLTCQN